MLASYGKSTLWQAKLSSRSQYTPPAMGIAVRATKPYTRAPYRRPGFNIAEFSNRASITIVGQVIQWLKLNHRYNFHWILTVTFCITRRFFTNSDNLTFLFPRSKMTRDFTYQHPPSLSNGTNGLNGSSHHVERLPGPISEAERLDVLIVGAGFAGVYLLYQLRRRGFTVKAVEMGSDIGGVWHWNRYPGARVDTQYPVYCYSLPEV